MSLFRVFRHPVFWHEWPALRSAVYGSRVFDSISREMEELADRMMGSRTPFRTIDAVEKQFADKDFTVVNNKDKFSVSLDVSKFKPEEIKVKTVKQELVIEGAHEERSDEQGFISTKFHRRLSMPEDIDLQAMHTRWATDGTLTIEAPKKALESNAERTIPIEHVKE